MVTVIFPAAGQGKRMQAGMNKVFMELSGMPIFIRTLLKFSNCEAIDNLIVVVGKDEVDFIRGIISKVPGLKPYKVVAGGSERQYSVRNGLAAVDPATEIVLVHDAARPLVSEDTILATIKAAEIYGGAVAGVKAKNTIKVCDDSGMVQSTPNRDYLWEIQTPQGFKVDVILQAHEQAARDNFLGTDEASLVERIGLPVKIVESDYKNIKLTTPEDVIIAEAFLRSDFAGAAINTLQDKLNGILEIADELKNRFIKK